MAETRETIGVAEAMSEAVPGYWMNEQSGVLRPAIEAYLRHQSKTPIQIATVRAYLRQWIGAPAWKGPMIDVLRTAESTRYEANTQSMERWQPRSRISRVPAAHRASHRLGVQAVPYVSRRGTDRRGYLSTMRRGRVSRAAGRNASARE